MRRIETTKIECDFCGREAIAAGNAKQQINWICKLPTDTDTGKVFEQGYEAKTTCCWLSKGDVDDEDGFKEIIICPTCFERIFVNRTGIYQEDKDSREKDWIINDLKSALVKSNREFARIVDEMRGLEKMCTNLSARVDVILNDVEAA